MKNLDLFLPYVLLDCPGCSDAAALSALQSSVIEFCEKSLLIVRDHDPVNVTAQQHTYDLDSPLSQMLVCKVMKAWYQNRVLIPVAPDDMDDPSLFNGSVAVVGEMPTHFMQKDERTISLWRIPASAGPKALTMRVALKPTRACDSVDDVLFEDWVDVISAGAKASLMITPAKTFTNPQMASFNQGIFNAGINRAMVRSNKGHTRANLSVRMRQL